MRNQYCMALSLILLLFASACHKRSEIVTSEDPQVHTENSVILEPAAPSVTNNDWKNGSPQALVGNWASSLFRDDRCTAFYTFTEQATAELNLICLNTEKKQIEREFRRYAVAQYPGTQQIRLKPIESSCPEGDTRSINADGAAFLFAVENKPANGQGQKLVLWEPDVNKSPFNMSKSDGLMVEGFPGKTGAYLGMPIISGCFTAGLVANFQPMP